jgi:hypothetical protein
MPSHPDTQLLQLLQLPPLQDEQELPPICWVAP